MSKQLGTAEKEAFGRFMKARNSVLDRCLAPGAGCKATAIRAHSLQNAQVLGLLEINGHVIKPKLDLSLNRIPRVNFVSVGRNEATTFHGLCIDHDSSIFAPIERTTIDFSNAEHLFLLAYRAVLKEAHSSLKAARDTQIGYQAGVETGAFGSDAEGAGLHATETWITAFLANEQKLFYDGAYMHRNFDRIRHKVVDLATPPSIGVNSMFSTGHPSNISDGPAFVSLNVIPTCTSTVAVFSYPAPDQRPFMRSYGRSLARDRAIANLSMIILKRCENFIWSPKAFASFSEAQKEECRIVFQRNIPPFSYESKLPHLVNVFARVDA